MVEKQNQRKQKIYTKANNLNNLTTSENNIVQNFLFFHILEASNQGPQKHSQSLVGLVFFLDSQIKSFSDYLSPIEKLILSFNYLSYLLPHQLMECHYNAI